MLPHLYPVFIWHPSCFLGPRTTVPRTLRWVSCGAVVCSSTSALLVRMFSPECEPQNIAAYDKQRKWVPRQFLLNGFLYQDPITWVVAWRKNYLNNVQCSVRMFTKKHLYHCVLHDNLFVILWTVCVGNIACVFSSLVEEKFCYFSVDNHEYVDNLTEQRNKWMLDDTSLQPFFKVSWAR